MQEFAWLFGQALFFEFLEARLLGLERDAVDFGVQVVGLLGDDLCSRMRGEYFEQAGAGFVGRSVERDRIHALGFPSDCR